MTTPREARILRLRLTKRKGREWWKRGKPAPPLAVAAEVVPGWGQGAPPAVPDALEEPTSEERRRLEGEIRATGEVWCPMKMARIARDRCVALQHRMGCGKTCPLGAAVRQVRAEEILVDARADERAAVARALYAKKPPPRGAWKLVCQYRMCGAWFLAKRSWSAKPRYCSALHQKLEAEARKFDRLLGPYGGAS